MQKITTDQNQIQIDYQKFLEDASRTMIRFKNPQHLIRMITRTIDEQVKTAHTAALLYKEDKKYFVLIESEGVGGKKIPIGYIRLNLDNPLITVFLESRNNLLDEYGALTYDSLNTILKDKHLLREDPLLKDTITAIKIQLDLYEAKICIPSYFKKKLLGILLLGDKLNDQKFTKQEIGFFMTLANDVAMAIANAQLIENLQEKIKEIEVHLTKEHQLFIQTTVALSRAIDARDQYTHGHTERVTNYTLIIGEELSNSPLLNNYKNFKEKLYIAALLHDIGKIGIPDGILNKKEPLTNEEFDIIKRHSQIGAAILKPIEELKDIVDFVLHHHERYDGTGYPEGLKDDDIPLGSQIIAVADAFDAMITNRPYRSKRPPQEAMEEIKRCSGAQFHPQVVEAFLKAFDEGKIKEYV